MVGLLKRLLPVRLKHALKMRIAETILPELKPGIRATADEFMTERGVALRSDILREKGVVLRRDILSGIYDAWRSGDEQGNWYLHADQLRSAARDGDLPVPPPALRQGYCPDSDEEYIYHGGVAADHVRKIWVENGIAFDGSSVVLDWGCASGRIMRHFREDAARCVYWGTDLDERCIVWARENLSPPFRFVTCTAYPHLPFEDNFFTHIYGISIFTHGLHLADAWLMELRRILKPGGHLMVTVHTEASLDEFKHGFWPPWLERDADLEAIRGADLSSISQGSWDTTFSFYREEWLRAQWSRFLDIVEVRPGYVPHAQTAVLMRK